MKKKPIHRMRLQTLLFTIFSLLLTVCLIIASTIIVGMSYDLYTEEAVATSQRDLALVTNSLESTIKRISNTAISIASDRRIIAAARQYPGAPKTEIAKSVLRSTLGLNVGTIIGASTDVFMWDIISLSGQSFGVSGYDFSNLHDLSGTPIDVSFFQGAATKLRTQISGIYCYKSSSLSIPVFIVSKVIVDLDSRKPLGILLILVRESRISKVFTGNASAHGVEYAIIDENDHIVSSLTKEHLNVRLSDVLPFNQEQYEQLRNTGIITTGSYANSTLYSISKGIDVGYSDWRILMVHPMTYANENWYQTLTTVIIFFLVMSMVLFIACYLISRSLTRPLNCLVNSIRIKTTADYTQPVPDPGGSYEISILHRSYNEQLSHIAKLIDHINQEQEEKSNYKFQLIQAQIKPHFLYNTLMIIKSLIDLGMNHIAGDCVYAMSNFYRLSLNKGNDILTLADEMELCMHYMYIQKLRYIDRLDYMFDVPKALYHYLIPKMTIQPILENAIYHGIKEKEERGIIEVTGREDGDQVIVTISDNGCGMCREALQNLRASIDTPGDDIHPRSESFGLYSVNRRIQLIYGTQYGVSVDSRLGEYTTVMLTLPKHSNHGGST